MDMTGGSTMNMGTANTSSSTGMGMDMGSGTCTVSMLWNWDTVGACFISESWQITSGGMFAGSCIGVVLLVILLEFFRRLSREYERYVTRSRSPPAIGTTPSKPSSLSSGSGSNADHEKPKSPATRVRQVTTRLALTKSHYIRPTMLQQAVRALLHMVQFGLAYFVMLLAMYYNGYLIICILIGAFLGSFIFSWDMSGPAPKNDACEVTYCCGFGVQLLLLKRLIGLFA